MKKNFLNRIVTFMLVIIMVTGILPANVSANYTLSNDDIIYNLPDLPTTSDSYILVKNTASKDIVLLVGVSNGYFGSDTKTIWDYNSSYSVTNFAESYVSSFNNEKYSEWTNNDVGKSFSLSGYEILYKSKPMYPVSPSWVTGHIFTVLPEGVTWDDKIIISNSNGTYRLYKPANNDGMWVDAKNVDCDFYYRDTLTSSNQTLSEYYYNTTSRTWTKKTYGRTQGYPREIFYVGSDVFSTDGTVKRAGQHDFYAQSSKQTEATEFKFKPLEPAEAKEFLAFISNLSTSNVEQELPEYYGFLTGTVPDTLDVRVSFVTYLYYCLDVQLAQSNKRIDIGTTYLINWVEDNTSIATTIYDQIKGELVENLGNTFLKAGGAPELYLASNIATSLIDYSMLLITAVGSILEVRRVDDINYLTAYIKLLEAQYENNQNDVTYWELICEAMILDSTFGGNPQEMRKYAEYIFSIEHGISNYSTN